MPEGMEASLDLQAMADLIGYLMQWSAKPDALKRLGCNQIIEDIAGRGCRRFRSTRQADQRGQIDPGRPHPRRRPRPPRQRWIFKISIWLTSPSRYFLRVSRVLSFSAVTTASISVTQSTTCCFCSGATEARIPPGFRARQARRSVDR